MPEPYEEIKALNGTKENPNSTRKVIEAEVRGKWEAENPGKSFNDALFKTEVQQWKADTQALVEDYGNRWNDQKLDIPAFRVVDSKLSLKLEPFSNDAPAKAIYRELLDRFGDTNVSHFPKAPWDLPPDAGPVWKDMLDITKQQVQRNATKLASVVTIHPNCRDRRSSAWHGGQRPCRQGVGGIETLQNPSRFGERPRGMGRSSGE